MPSVADFVAKFQSGARPNLFRVDIPMLGEDMKFYCKAAQIPGKTINPIEMRYLNNVIPIAGDQTFQDWSLTIVNDKDFLIRKRIEDWMSSIKANNETSGYTGLQYFKQAFVHQLDQNADEIATYLFYNMWPTDLGAIDLSFDSADTVEEYTVTLRHSGFDKVL